MTATSYAFFVPGIPKAQPRARACAIPRKSGKPLIRMYDPDSAKDWKTSIQIAARQHVPLQDHLGPIRVNVTFFMPRPKYHFRANGSLKPNVPYWYFIKPDRDNLDKAVLDALTESNVWGDDCQVCDGTIQKLYCRASSYNGQSGVAVEILPLCEQPGLVAMEV